MNTIRPCGCKGVRTCLQCEKDFNINKPSLQTQLKDHQHLTYCSACELLYPGWNVTKICEQHPDHENQTGIPFPGVYIQENFLNKLEAEELVKDLDDFPWTISQSGRRKQNFGPKTNFKKRKLQLGSFIGFPEFSAYIQQRFANVKLMKDFQTIEQCTLEYDSVKGACIDPHIDDCWVWGERVVTVNCLGDSVLTMTPFDGTSDKYNLKSVTQYENRLLHPLLKMEELEKYRNCVIRIPMPNLSLIVLYGPARYQFEHAVLREDIEQRRICIAYREFTPIYTDVDGESITIAGDVTKMACTFHRAGKLEALMLKQST